MRRQGLYYTVCRGKCEPILEHVLGWVDVAPNPMDTIPASAAGELEVLYKEEYFVEVNKPVGMLSAPGRTLKCLVYSLMKDKYPEATGPMLVHGLDMSTSGVLLVAKDKNTHKALASRFIHRLVQNRHVGENDLGSCHALPLGISDIAVYGSVCYIFETITP